MNLKVFSNLKWLLNDTSNGLKSQMPPAKKGLIYLILYEGIQTIAGNLSPSDFLSGDYRVTALFCLLLGLKGILRANETQHIEKNHKPYSDV